VATPEKPPLPNKHKRLPEKAPNPGARFFNELRPACQTLANGHDAVQRDLRAIIPHVPPAHGWARPRHASAWIGPSGEVLATNKRPAIGGVAGDAHEFN
jgi:hypothetical protein